MWTKHLDNLKEYRLLHIYDLLEHFAEVFNKRFPIQRIEIHIDQPKNAAGYPKQQFVTKLHILLQPGDLLIATGEDRQLITSMRKAIKKLKHEVEISDRQKYHIFFKYF